MSVPYLRAGGSLSFCWQSSIGVVGDPSRFGGLCVSNNGKCHWISTTLYSGFRSVTSTTLGCGLPPSFSDVTTATTTSGTIDWTNSGLIDPSFKCGTSSTTRFCEFDSSKPFEYPRMLTSATTYVPTAVPIPASEPVPGPLGFFPTMMRMCGCTAPASLFGTTDPTNVCVVDGSCVSCTTSAPAMPFYRCGTVLQAYGSGGDPEWKARLCFGCPNHEVGQCGKLGGSGDLASCASYDPNTGTCPSGYNFCGILGLPTYAMKIPAVAARNGAAVDSTFVSLGYDPSFVMFDESGSGGFVTDILPTSGAVSARCRCFYCFYCGAVFIVPRCRCFYCTTVFTVALFLLYHSAVVFTVPLFLLWRCFYCTTLFMVSYCLIFVFRLVLSEVSCLKRLLILTL